MPADERHRADGVFEGGGVKGIAFAGAIASAERDAGVQERKTLGQHEVAVAR